MQFVEGVLIIVILYIVYHIARSRMAKKAAAIVPATDPAPVAPVSTAATAPVAAESAAMKENMEYFAGNVDGQHAAELCGTGPFNYAVNEYGAPGMSWSDHVASAAVDPAVIKNHSEFVADRLSNKNQFITGPTMTPDSHTSYDPISWQGLRRPQAVAQYNPTQMPDIDTSLYETQPKFNWNSSM